MTLFRKVFHNQARPASGEDALDDEALRAAFNQMAEGRDTVRKDPFGDVDAPQPDTAPEQAGWDTPPKIEAPDVTDPDAEAVEATDATEAPFAATGATDVAEVVAWPEPLDTPEIQSQTELTMADITAALSRADDATPATQVAEPVDEPAPERAEEMQPEKALDLSAISTPDPAPAERQTPTPHQANAPKDAAPALDLSIPLEAAPTAGRAGRRAGRVKTRLLGFNRDADDTNDPFDEASGATAQRQDQKFPVGWLVIVEGPGTGHAFSLYNGASVIGRGEDQVIKLDFGDNSISRQNHAAIAYDEEDNRFYLGHGGKSNIIRRNGRPVLSTEELQQSDLIRIGETTLRFVALCGSDFKWEASHDDASPAV